MSKHTTTFEGQMDLTFVKENGRWYVDLPEFLESGAGDKDDLEMVAGADTFCEELSNGGNRLLKFRLATHIPFTPMVYHLST